MKKLSFVLGLVGLSVLGLACSGGDDPGALPLGAAPHDVAARLSELTGSTILQRQEADGTAPLYVSTSAGNKTMAARSSDRAKELLAQLGEGGARAETLGSASQWRTPDGGTSIRFEHVVPRTNVPVFDRATVVGVRDDGDLAYVALETVPDLHGFDVTPSISIERATHIAIANGAASDVKAEATLGVVVEGAEPRLIYRVAVESEDGLQVDVDAKTGEPIHTGSSVLGVSGLAPSAEAYYAAGDPRLVARSLPTTLNDRGELVLPTLAGEVHVTDGRTRLPVIGFEKGAGTLDLVDFDVSSKVTSGAGVNAQYNIGTAAEVLGAFGLVVSRPDRTIQVEVHAGPLANAAYNPTRKVLSIGDGAWALDQGKFPGYGRYSLATLMDVMAHELAHVGLVNLGLPNPTLPSYTPNASERQRFIAARALHEGLADILGAYVEVQHNRARRLSTAGALTIGEGFTRSERPMRDLLHPRSTFAEYATASHVSQPAPPPKDTSPRALLAAMSDEAYFRSGVISNVWALLAVGGVHDTSKIYIDAPLGFDLATAAFGLGAMSFRYSGRGVKDLADAMISTQLLPGPRSAVACAWAAVGVLDVNDIKSAYNVTCKIATAACAGKPDGYYCHPSQKYASYQCRSGSIAGAPPPCPTDHTCVRSSASIDSPAILDQGKPRCAFQADEYPR